MDNKTREIKEKKYMEVDIYDTDGDGFIDICSIALSLMDAETGDTLDVATIKKQLENLESLIKSNDTTSEASEKLIKDLKTLQDKVENAERTLDNKIVSNKMEQAKQIEQVKDLIINIQNVINTKADKIHMHNEYANKTHTHSYNDLINKPIINNNPKVNVIDNLDSTSTTSALSANQGKVLNGGILGVRTYLKSLELTMNNIDLSADKVKLSGVTGIQSNNVKGAIQELFTNADNGKRSISTIIGGPLSATDDFAGMKGKIQTLKNTFSNNLSSKGVSSNGNESLQSLINKVPNIGRRIITGKDTQVLEKGGGGVGYSIEYNADFTPSGVVVFANNPFKDSTVSNTILQRICAANINDTEYSFQMDIKNEGQAVSLRVYKPNKERVSIYFAYPGKSFNKDIKVDVEYILIE